MHFNWFFGVNFTIKWTIRKFLVFLNYVFLLKNGTSFHFFEVFFRQSKEKMQKFGEGSKPFKTYYAIFGGNAYSFTFVIQTVLVWTEKDSMRSNSYPYGFVGKYTPHVDGLWQFFPTKITILGGIRYFQAHAIFVLVGYISFLITSLLNPAQKSLLLLYPHNIKGYHRF